MGETKPTTVAVAPLLRYLVEQGISQTQFARSIDETPATITNWKRRGIPWNKLQATVTAMGITVDDYLEALNGTGVRHRHVAMANTSRLREILAANLRCAMAVNPSAGSQISLANRCGVAQSTISTILNCEQTTTLDILEKLAGGLRCQPWELLVDEHAVREEAIRRMLAPAALSQPEPDQQSAPFNNVDEARLLKFFRKLPSNGKRALLAAARAMRHPQEENDTTE